MISMAAFRCAFADLISIDDTAPMAHLKMDWK
jgi:hypothetical protein